MDSLRPGLLLERWSAKSMKSEMVLCEGVENQSTVVKAWAMDTCCPKHTILHPGPATAFSLHVFPKAPAAFMSSPRVGPCYLSKRKNAPKALLKGSLWAEVLTNNLDRQVHEQASGSQLRNAQFLGDELGASVNRILPPKLWDSPVLPFYLPTHLERPPWSPGPALDGITVPPVN